MRIYKFVRIYQIFNVESAFTGIIGLSTVSLLSGLRPFSITMKQMMLKTGRISLKGDCQFLHVA